MNRILLAAALALAAFSRPALAATLPCDPSASAIAYAPAKDTFGMVMFEDNWPANGDLDFNDQNIAWNFVFHETAGGKVSSMQVSLDVLSVGAAFRNGLYLHLPVPANAAFSILLNTDGGAQQPLTPLPGESDLIVQITPDTRQLFGAVGEYLNTDPRLAPVPFAAVNLIIQFGTPVTINVGDAPFDLFLARTGEAGHQIHRPAFGGTQTMDATLFGTQDDASTASVHFVNQNGLPFALTIPEVVAWPAENVPIDRVYPDISRFAASGGTQYTDWYHSSVVGTLTWQGSITTPVPPPAAIGPSLPAMCTFSPPGVCSTGNDPETASPWIVCRSDTSTAWLSANNAGFYHVDQICRQLGYNGFLRYGGNCGSVCGFCDAPAVTSCTAPGREFYDGNGDCGLDVNGQIVCFTVTWQCGRTGP